MVTNPTDIYEGAVSIPSLAQWVKDPALLWLWHRPAAAAPIRPLAWDPPYAAGAALKRNKTKQMEGKEKCIQMFSLFYCHIRFPLSWSQSYLRSTSMQFRGHAHVSLSSVLIRVSRFMFVFSFLREIVPVCGRTASLRVPISEMGSSQPY